MDKFVERQEVLKLLNAPTPEERLANLAILIGGEKEKPEVKPQFANNHIHTIYSFSPYSPTAAVYCARAFRQPESWIMTVSPEPWSSGKRARSPGLALPVAWSAA